MNGFNEGWLLSTAPVEVLLGLCVFFIVAAALLAALSIEAGRYPEIRAWLRAFGSGIPRIRSARRRKHPIACFTRSIVFTAGGNS